MQEFCICNIENSHDDNYISYYLTVLDFPGGYKPIRLSFISFYFTAVNIFFLFRFPQNKKTQRRVIPNSNRDGISHIVADFKPCF